MVIFCGAPENQQSTTNFLSQNFVSDATPDISHRVPAMLLNGCIQAIF